jgi:hypothetical protein
MPRVFLQISLPRPHGADSWVGNKIPALFYKNTLFALYFLKNRLLILDGLFIGRQRLIFVLPAYDPPPVRRLPDRREGGRSESLWADGR